MSFITTLTDKAKAYYNDYTWLDGPTGNEAADKYLHWGAILAGSLMSWVDSVSPIATYAAGTEAFDLVNTALTIFADPNIEGIPIKAESQNTSRDIDVSRQMIIAQDSGGEGGKQWVTDNAAPHPRVWRIRGYLKSLSGALDSHLVVKPTLQMQLGLLDYYSASRRPVWFKAHYSLFYRVLVEHFDYEFDPKTQNSVLVNITLCEFIANMAYSNKAGKEDATRVQDRDTIGEPAQMLDIPVG